MFHSYLACLILSYRQYIPQIMHMVLTVLWIVMGQFWAVLPIFFRVTSLALGKCYHWPFVKEIHQWPVDFPHKESLTTHWGQDKMATILQTFSNAFSWIKMYKFRLRFHWSFFPRVEFTIFQHWFRWWLGAVQATSHYLNQWWYSLLMCICVTRPQWVNMVAPVPVCNWLYFLE